MPVEEGVAAVQVAASSGAEMADDADMADADDEAEDNATPQKRKTPPGDVVCCSEPTLCVSASWLPLSHAHS